MADWECKACKALTSEETVKCWNCGRSRSDKSPIPQKSTTSSADSTNQTWIILAAVGGALILGGLFRLNSFESQFVRGMGGQDNAGIALLVAGAVLGLIGISNMSSKKSSQSESGSGSIGPGAPAAETASSSGTDAMIVQIEKLAELKEKGIITQQEFDEQKQSLLTKMKTSALSTAGDA